MNQKASVTWVLWMVGFLFLFSTGTAAAQLKIWANNGEDKVTRDELRASSGGASVANSVWDGSRVSVFGAKNEVVSFNLVLESPSSATTVSKVVFDALSSPSQTIQSAAATGDGIFNFVGRPIELFYIRYLQIRGLSLLSYDALYDERHVPERFRRPWTGEGEATGTWEDRPDHDKYYPDIAVPLELVPEFTIAANTNQSIWVDIYIPKTAGAGSYTGAVSITESTGTAHQVPVSLTVRNFTLPDTPSAKTMLVIEPPNINQRYLHTWVETGDENYSRSLEIIDRHFQVAHRHKISLIDSTVDVSEMADAWTARLDGSLFTAAKGYDGPGVGVGNNVFSIGTYSSWTWAWSEELKEEMWTHTDLWVDWFDARAFSTPTEYFLYLIDESDDFATTEKWAAWMDENPGSGSRLLSMATISDPVAWQNYIPSLDIPTSGIAVGITDLWETATTALVNDPSKRFYYYNGARPASGSFCTEDDGVALRLNGWIQFKKKIDRWFFWESTYYDNYQGEQGETDVFNQAFTYGSYEGIDTEFHRGRTGWNYMNGDGVLFYPGTDLVYPDENYGVSGPFASLRLKHWRRGIQDADYLYMAAAKDSAQTNAVVNRMIPKVLWEYGVENPEDPSYKYTDISWSTDPDDWEAARRELADLIEGTSSQGATTHATAGADLTVIIYSLPVGSGYFNVTLLPCANAREEGYFWTLGPLAAAPAASSGSVTLGGDFSLTFAPITLPGRLEADLVMRLYSHPDDPTGWYWKLDMATLSLR